MSHTYALFGCVLGITATISTLRFTQSTETHATTYFTSSSSSSLLSGGAPSLPSSVVYANPPRTLPEDAERAIARRARREVDLGVRYDATYRMLPTYPNGDIPVDRGACTDVVIRSYRAIDVDLQVLVHEDLDNPGSGDANVDHRRVTTLHTYFSRNALSLSTDPRSDPTSFRPGDVLFYAWKRCYPNYPCYAEHVAIVSDRIGPRGLPLVLQNGGPVATESDGLDHPTLIGHYRLNEVFHVRQKNR